MKREIMKRVYAVLLMLAICIFGTACGDGQQGGGSEAEGRVMPYLERSQIKSNWDLIQFYMGLSEDCVGFLSDAISAETDRVGDAFIEEADEKVADGEFRDVDFLTYSSLSLVHWMTPLNGVKLTPFQEKSIKKIRKAHEKIRGCEIAVSSRKDGDYTYYDAEYDLPDKEGTWHSCREVQCFSVKNCYWSSEKYVDGVLTGFYGFRWLGDDRYALSSNYVRAIMTYDDKRHVIADLDLSTATQAIVLLEEYADHSFNFDDPFEFNWQDRFDPSSESWVSEGEDRGGIFRRFQYDGDKLTISGLARTLSGEVKTKDAKFDTNYEVEISVGNMAE